MQAFEYFPGANTPNGFFSYYQHILPYDEARHIVILKGGPGTGKSTIMKKVGTLLNELGYSTERLHCSSDPDSLDAVVCREIGFCILDGTSPHNVDPRFPGAVETIVNLGDYWDTSALKNNRDDIMHLSQEITESFAAAYAFFQSAGALQKHINNSKLKHTNQITIRKLADKLAQNLNLDTGRNVRKQPMKGFLTAVTHRGNTGYIDSFAAAAEQIYCIESENAPTDVYTKRLAEIIENSGISARFFYCPMQPDTKIEHIFLPDEKILITTKNAFHSTDCSGITIALDAHTENSASTQEDTELFSRLLSRATEHLRTAKTLHDQLESLYIPHMNFNAIASLPSKIVSSIL